MSEAMIIDIRSECPLVPPNTLVTYECSNVTDMFNMFTVFNLAGLLGWKCPMSMHVMNSFVKIKLLPSNTILPFRAIIRSWQPS